MPMPSPTDAAARWVQQFGASGARWAAGVQGVGVAPGQMAARAKALWLQNTAAAGDRFAANSAAVTREQWIEQTISKGQPRLSSGAQAAQAKVEQVFAKLFPFIDRVRGGLPPRGDIEQNINRAAQFARGMHAFKTGG